MKKNKIVLGLFAISFALFSFATFRADVFNVDKSASKILWKGEKVTGFHTGEIMVSSGSFQVEGNKVVGGSFEVDMKSMTCTDLKDKMAEKLVGHLKSDDFFGVEKFATSKLSIKKITSQGKDDYKVIADLTIKGITKEVKFPAKITLGKELKATAKIVIDRSDYDIRYGSGSFFDDLGDKTIYDNFELTIDVVAKK